MKAESVSLCATEGPPYSPRDVGEILGIRDYHAVLGRWRRVGTGPPFLRLGRKHSRLWYPREAFWKWIESRSEVEEELIA